MPGIAENKQYNIALDIYRILFTTMIMLHHFRSYSDVMPYGGGYMATDFFFMLSGYLMYITANIHDKKSATGYIIGRYKRLVIPLITCNLILICLLQIFTGYRLSNGLLGFAKENLMIEFFTCDISERFNPPMWYLGTLFLATIICCPILYFSKLHNLDKITKVLMGIIIGAYIILVFMNGSGNIYTESATVFAWKSVLRGIGGMSVGIIIATIPIKTKTINIKWVVFGVFVIIYLYLMAWNNGYTRFDILTYILIAFGVVLCKSLPGVNNPKITFTIILLGKASYYAYIIHYPIIRLIDYYRIYDGLDWKIYSIIFVSSIWIIAILCHESALASNKLIRRTSNV